MIMKTLIKLTLCAALACLCADDVNADTHPLNREAYAWAVAMFETGCKNEAIGAAGERSKFQFMRATWEEYSSIPFTQASKSEEAAEKVFRIHLDWQLRALRQLGLVATPYNLYLLHQAGYGNLRRGTVPTKSHEDAQLVTNLYHLSIRKN